MACEKRVEMGVVDECTVSKGIGYVAGMHGDRGCIGTKGAVHTPEAIRMKVCMRVHTSGFIVGVYVRSE